VINITLNFETIAEAQNALERLQGAGAAKAEATAIIQKAAKVAKVEDPKPAPIPTVSETASTTPPVVVATPEPAVESPSEPTVTYDEVAALVLAHMKVHGRPATVAMLKPFEITALTGAKPEQYASIKAVFEAVAA